MADRTSGEAASETSDEAANQAAPEAVAYVRDLLDGFDRPWFLCGGWAADAWLGRPTRDHGDVDIAVFHDDQRALFDYFEGWALVGHDPNVPDDTNQPWNGRHLDMPAHIHVPTPASPLATSPSTSAAAAHASVEFEFLLVERCGQDWVLNRKPYLAAPVQACTRQSPWGLPAAVPEIVLFYKAGGDLGPAEAAARGGVLRPRDEQDFRALLPILGAAQRTWLRESLGTVRPGHPWLPRLGP